VIDKDSIQFSENYQTKYFVITKKAQIHQLAKAVDLGSGKPALVLIGGAAGLEHPQANIIRKITDVIAQAAESIHAAVIDGGTQAGVMAAIGHSRSKEAYQFPLIGVAVEKLVTWPGNFQGQRPRSALFPAGGYRG